jgi:hypothetical protein
MRENLLSLVFLDQTFFDFAQKITALLYDPNVAA